MELGCEAGFKPKGFWNSTIPEIISMIEGYRKRLYHEYSISRDIRYAIYCVVTDPNRRVDIWEWQPLEGDPSKEEIEKMKLREQIKIENDLNATVDYYVSRGVKREDIMV